MSHPYFIRSLLVTACLSVCGSTWPASPWPEFRGPTGDGVSTAEQLPVRWSEDTGVVWKTAIPGKAWSSPVIWDGPVWITNATTDGKRLSVLAIERETGNIVHDVTIFKIDNPQFCHDFNSYASPTPVIEPGRLYAHFGSAGTACLNTKTGKILWSRQDLPCDHFRGPGSSPILYDDLLIVAFDGFDYQYVVALNTKNGQTVWKTDRNIEYGTDNGDMKKAYATATVIAHGGRDQVVVPSAGATIAYDPESGKELWRVNHGGMNASARPLYSKGILYLNTAAGGMGLLAVTPDGRGNISSSNIVWKSSRGSGTRSSQLILGNQVVLLSNSGVLSFLNTLTGKSESQKRLKGEFSASPLLTSDNIYLCNQEGETSVVSAKKPHDIVSVNSLDEGCMASPAVYDNALFLRTKSHLYKIQNP
ncbi:MAG: PQQ-binding-like beta-propeller repeat protein [Pirellulales bacterium]